MEAGESDTDTGSRKRTESNSGNSDSDFSDGWNIVDHLDVPSSDGESVEVIEPESADLEIADEAQPDGENNQLLLKPETPVVPADQGELSPAERPVPQHEEMFDSSFCWFLFFAVSVVLVSDVAFMVTESVLDWNVGVTKYVNQPSFLTDLPVTPRLQVPQRGDLPSKMSWDNKEEVTVESVDIHDEEEAEEIVQSTGKEHWGSSNNDCSAFNENRQKLPLKIDNHDVGKYFRDLSEMTVSNEAQSKFSQTLLILDALHIGLNDLEDVVAESSELHQVLKNQKKTLVNVIAEVQSGVARSMEKMATNVLHKVQRLERHFEIEWCRLEKAGHKDKLKGLFYDCRENEENRYDKKSQYEGRSLKKNKIVKESYQYEVDKDSAGKEFKSHENTKENYVYNDFIINERHAENNYDNTNKQTAQSMQASIVAEIHEYENRYKENQFRETKKYEDVEKQYHKRNTFNDEINKKPNNQKSVKHENSEEYYSKKSIEGNLEKDKRNTKENDVYNDFVRNERHSENNYDNTNKQTAQSMQASIVAEIHEYENRYKENQFRETKKYEDVEKQYNHKKNTFNDEINKKPNNQKSFKHENSEEYYSKKSIEGNLEEDKKYSKAEYKHSESKNFHRDDQTKNKETTHYEKSGKDEYKKSSTLRDDENLGKFEHRRFEDTFLDKSNHYEKNVKLKTSKDNDCKDKFTQNLNHRVDKFRDEYSNVRKEESNNPTSEESSYQKGDYDKKPEPNKLKKAAEKLGKYLKEKCDKNRQKTTDLYNKVKEGVKEKMKIPLELFNSMFNKYCSTNKIDKKVDDPKKEQLKGEYKRNSHDRTLYLNDEMITVEDHVEKKGVVDLKLTREPTEIGLIGKKDKNIEQLSEKLHQWTSIYDSPSLHNESNYEGDWFIKVGESRSQARWYQRRSDWLFDRASHRRGAPSTPHSLFAGRRKNWFFRRAWAREHCREAPDSYWCHPSQDETVTIPGSSFS